jgi:hypothetical protein
LGGLKNLKNRLIALLLILYTRIFPAYRQVRPSSANEILEIEADHSLFFLLDDYRGCGAGIMAASTNSMLVLQEKSATYFPIVFCLDQVDVHKRCQ